MLHTEADQVKFRLKPQLFSESVDVGINRSGAEIQFFPDLFIAEAFITEFHEQNFSWGKLFLAFFLPFHIVQHC